MILILKAKKKNIKKRAARSLASSTKSVGSKGFALSVVKKKSPLHQLGLKKKDVIKKVNGESISSMKKLLHLLQKAKPGKKNHLVFERGKKSWLLYFKVKKIKVSVKGKKSKVKRRQYQKIKLMREKVSSKKRARVQKKSKKQKRKNIISWDEFSKKEMNLLNKNKKRLQKGYIFQESSFIYSKPNFDSKKVQYLPQGTYVVMSKKIYAPPSKFGTFYKVFFNKNKKEVGFVSEAEVEPQFQKNGSLNLRYKVIENPAEKLKLKALSNQNSKKTEKKVESESKGRFFVGLTYGLKDLQKISSIQSQALEYSFVGLNLDIDSFLNPYLYVSLNIMADISSFQKKHLSVIGFYKLFNAVTYWGYLGVGADVNMRNQEPPQGKALLSAAFKTLLFQRVYWKNELRFSFQPSFADTSSLEAFTSLQIRF